jgi:hypothetical protein
MTHPTLFETDRGMEQAMVGTSGTLTLQTDNRELIAVVTSGEILRKIDLMVKAGDRADGSLPLNCRATAKWLMRDDKSQSAETGMEQGTFIDLKEAKQLYGYPLGIEWSTGHERNLVSPFHEGVILGAVGDDELVFEKPGYDLPYQFSLLSVLETRHEDSKKNRYYLRSFYGARDHDTDAGSRSRRGVEVGSGLWVGVGSDSGGEGVSSPPLSSSSES